MRFLRQTRHDCSRCVEAPQRLGVGGGVAASQEERRRPLGGDCDVGHLVGACGGLEGA